MRWIGHLIAGVSLCFVCWKLWLHFPDIPALKINIFSSLAFLLMLTYLAIVPIFNALCWSLFLKRGNIELSILKSYSIIGRSQIAKYLPGNVFQFVNRFFLGKKYGIPQEVIAITLGLETLLVALTALILTLLGFMSSSIPRLLLDQFLTTRSHAILWLFVLGTVIVLFVILLGIAQVRRWVHEHIHYLYPVLLLKIIAINSIVFLALGPLILLLVKGIWNIEVMHPWYQFSFGYTFAWFLGFIVPGAPGGIGIREAIFVSLFGPQLGDGVAVSLAVVLRVITIISDLVTFSIASWIGRYHTPQAENNLR